MIIQTLLEISLIITLYMSACFVIARIKKDNSIVDIAWGLGFILIAWLSFFKHDPHLARHILITILITIWGLRISGYIFVRNFGKKEDIRYTEMKKKWGTFASLYSFFIIFMLQGFLILVIGYPIIIINLSKTAGLTLFDYIGTTIWLCGFLFETVGDWQLFQFLKRTENKGKILTHGLWRYTRHPNYFGETLIWWGIWFIALSVPYGMSAIISPLTITYLLLYVSGVPLAERQIEQLEGYETYKKQTSVFIPWFVKKESY